MWMSILIKMEMDKENNKCADSPPCCHLLQWVLELSMQTKQIRKELVKLNLIHLRLAMWMSILIKMEMDKENDNCADLPLCCCLLQWVFKLLMQTEQVWKELGKLNSIHLQVVMWISILIKVEMDKENENCADSPLCCCLLQQVLYREDWQAW